MEVDDGILNDNDAAKLRALIGGDENEEALVFSEEEMDVDAGNDADDAVAEGEESFAFSDDDDARLSDADIDEAFEFHNALRDAANFKVKPNRKKKKKGGLSQMQAMIRREATSPEVKALLSEANVAFVQQDLEKAQKLFLEVVKIDNTNFAAYKTLGEIALIQENLNNCSNFWMLAAHLHAWDYKFWREVAELSLSLHHQRQAMYCYTKAIRASKHKDYSSIFDRARLYRERHKFKRATDSLLKLREALPHDPAVVRELAKVYVDENRVNDAITMYNKILEDNVVCRRKSNEEDKLNTIKFDFSELNILCELYSGKCAWSLGIKALKQTARWIQHRENQKFWNEYEDADIEFDDRRFANHKFEALSLDEKRKDYTLPIDLRVQLGLFRLNCKNQNKENEEEAKIHFSFLLEEPLEDMADLYKKVGMELESFGLYKEALNYLIPLSTLEDQYTTDLVLAIAKCQRETEDFEGARESYMLLLEYDPENIEVKINLAEVCFYLRDTDTTTRLYKEAKEQRAKEKASARLLTDQTESEPDIEDELVEEDDFDTEPALIADLPTRPTKRKKVTLSEAEFKTLEEKSQTRTQKMYERAERLQNTLDQGSSVENRAAASVWIELALNLIELFSMYRCFFSSERARKFNVDLRKRITKQGVDYQLSRMRYLGDEIILSSHYEQPEQALQTDSFKGIKYEQWYDLFMKYALMISKYDGDVESATSILGIARHINVFQKMELTTTLVGLSVGLIVSDHNMIQDQLRALMNDYQFSPTVLKTFLASYVPDSYNSEHYADASTQKYILRQVKAYDSLREGGKPISGMAAITNHNVDLEHSHPLLNYIYASFLYLNKSYYSSLLYCLKLYSDFNNDPSLLLLLALSNLNRSTQRKTLNTNFQILQGFTFLFEYTKLKDMSDPYQKMETLYNVGRAFHQLGLDNIAIDFYQIVLDIEVEDERYDLKKESAYNLYMIYNIHHNFEYAEEIMNKYLVV